jgi:DMSO/TMAO reductase YedYZ molybdopterin-dependent catalytic subunit
VGGSLFVFATGVVNIQIYYPWAGMFSFIPAHYYGAFVFLAGLGLHVFLKLPIARAAFRERGVLAPLRESREATTPEPPLVQEEMYEWGGSTAPTAPHRPTISRRGLLGLVGASSVGLAVMGLGQVVGGPLRGLALLAPRGRDLGDGPNDFPVNKTAQGAGIRPDQIGPGWRLELAGPLPASLSRDELLAMPQRTETLPIACVEGWTSTQEWTGVSLRDLAARAGVDGEPGRIRVQSFQGGALGTQVLNPGFTGNPRTLLALRVNGAELSPDHGFPARVIAPALPGARCTKWVMKLTFEV